jgi:3-oxoacyl-[acyl-carrier-protein] synthase-3
VKIDNEEDPSPSGAESNGSVFKKPGKASYECLQMNGKEVFRFAVRAVPQVVEGALQEAGLVSENIDWLLLHQVCGFLPHTFEPNTRTSKMI